jgi:translation initiation factor IF-3
MDFGKFKFDEAQRAKESRRKTTSTSIKEMKYRPKIGSGDFDTKTRQVQRFLTEGHKVKITIMFRGREMSHPELGKKILDMVAAKVAPAAKVEAAPKLDGRNMIMVLAPDRRAQQAAQANRGAGHEADAVSADRPGEAPPVQGKPAQTAAAPPARGEQTQPADPPPTAAPAPQPAAPAPAPATNGRAGPSQNQPGVRRPAPTATAPDLGAAAHDSQES